MKNINLDMKTLFEHLESNKSLLEHSFHQYDKIWQIQGKIYWLRYLIALREHYLEKLTRMLYPSLKDICIEQFLKDVDKCYVLIHKRFIESNLHSAMSFLSGVINLIVSSSKSKNSDISKTIKEKLHLREMCQFLTRVPTPYNEKSFFREDDLIQIYYWFYLSLSIIDSKFVDAVDLPENFDDNPSSISPYWLPLPKWTDKDYKPGFFERYLSHFWRDKLPKLLLTPNVHTIFARKVDHICCPLSDGTRNQFVLDFFYTMCPCKEGCRKVILHSEDCSNPYLCFGSAKCKMSCESTMKKHEVTYEKQHPGAWECFQCFTYESKHDNCRDVATQAQKMPISVFTFIPEMNHAEKDVSEILSKLFSDKYTIYQSNSKQEMRARLLHKLTKQQKESAAQYDKTMNNLSLFRDPNYQLTLYKKAKRKFNEELKTMLPYTFHKWGIEFHHFSPNRFNMENRTKASSYQSSIGIGYELLTDFSVVESKVKATVMSSIQSKLNEQVSQADCIQNGDNKPSEKAIKSDCYYSDETNQCKEMRREDGCANNFTVDNPSYSKVVEKETNSKDTSMAHEINALEVQKQSLERENKSQYEICEEFLSVLGTANEKLFSRDGTKVSMEKKPEKPKSRELRFCAFCMAQEEKIRSFLKCSLCKKGNFKEQRYYCSKNCQSEDWKERHRVEHKNNLIE